MKRQHYTTIFFSLVMFISTIALYAQTSNKPSFTVEGEVLKPFRWTQEDLLKLEQTEIKAKDHDGKPHTFKGVRLVDILHLAGVTLGQELRGANLRKYVLLKAVDGYEVVFSLPELDPEFTNQTIILAYQMDGKPLPKGEGPFRIIAANDKRHARWIKELISIRVLFSKA